MSTAYVSPYFLDNERQVAPVSCVTKIVDGPSRKHNDKTFPVFVCLRVDLQEDSRRFELKAQPQLTRQDTPKWNRRCNISLIKRLPSEAK